MNDEEILDKIINEGAKVPRKNENNSFSALLIEEQCPGCEILIKGIPSDAIIINLSRFPDFSCCFNSFNGECKKADYIIISEKKKCILYIELKKRNAENSEIAKQLTGAKCCCTYLTEIGRNFYNEGDFLKNYNERYIAFAKIKIDKRPSILKRNMKKHSSPTNFIKIFNSKSIHFNQIA